LVYNAKIRQNIIRTQRNLIFNTYLKSDTSYHDNIPVGNLVNIITTEVNNAVSGVMAPMELIVYIVMLFGYLFMLVLLSWEMTFLSVIILFLASRVPNIWIKKSAKTGRKVVDANTLMSGFLVGRLKSPRLVRLAGTEAAEINEFYKLTNKQHKHIVFGNILQAKTEVAMEPIVIGLSLAFLYFSVTTMNLQIEVIGLYLVIALRLLPIVKGVISQWQTVQRFLGSIEIIENRLKEMRSSFEKDIGTENLSQLKYSIKLDGVSYRYPTSNSDVLTDITVDLKANNMVAIVGPSGSGKSTLVDLLLRLRLPNKGTIQINDLNIEKYTLKSLRGSISYVPQSPQIFDGTIKNHITYGKENATDEEILEAVHLSGVESFINKLPHGLNTIIGEDAIKLSGGQRQRLDLARALIRKSPILILDEPTSNLDVESEELFRQVLARIHKETDTTIIIVSHRLACISDADMIIVLKQGKIERCGIHSDLIDQNGWYAKAWKMQK
jgi:ABC-type multidrug transport system fused ATPase/permease subunit